MPLQLGYKTNRTKTKTKTNNTKKQTKLKNNNKTKYKNPTNLRVYVKQTHQG